MQTFDSTGFLEQIRLAQHAYAERRLNDYLKSFSSEFIGVQLHSEDRENFVEMRQRVAQEMERFDLLTLDYRVITQWFTRDIGYAHVQHFTRLRFKDTGRVLVDLRENIASAQIGVDGVWRFISVIAVKVESFIEGSVSRG